MAAVALRGPRCWLGLLGDEDLGLAGRVREAERLRPPALPVNEGAGAELDEQFEQHGVRHLAVEDDRALDPPSSR